MSDTLSVDRYFEQQAQLGQQKQQLIESLLREKATIDEKLKRLGYQNPMGK